MRKWWARRGPAWGLVRDLLVGVALWLFLTTAVGEARLIPSSSMEPTLLPGDRIWTDKLLLRFRSLKRGDIVVFDPPVPSDTPYIKRVIGLPGERVEVGRGRVWVDGRPLAEAYIAEPPVYQYGPVQIGEDQYLVLGDNRNQSEDGHFFGLISREDIKSQALWRYWPLARWGSLHE